MNMNELAQAYLRPCANKIPFPAQVAYANLLDVERMDFSMDSLDYIDGILDSIRAADKPQFEAFIAKQENQSFLFVLCFYVGTTVAHSSNQIIAWLDYDSMIEELPENAAMYPRSFPTAATCVLEKSGWFVPLSAICSRLFDESPEKSVKLSAAAFLPLPAQ
jgi:hypothetical protein